MIEQDFHFIFCNQLGPLVPVFSTFKISCVGHVTAISIIQLNSSDKILKLKIMLNTFVNITV